MSALDRARQVQPGSTVRWDRLEREAFAAHPEVLAGPTPRPKRPLTAWRRATLTVGLVVAVAVLGSPIWGLIVVSERTGGRFSSYGTYTDPAEKIPQAGSLYLVALVVLLVATVVWWRAGRPTGGGYIGYLLMTVVVGTMTAVVIRRRGEEGEVATWESWVIPVLATTVLAGVLVLAQIAMTVGRARSTPSFDNHELRARRARVTDLDDAQQSAIRADLHAAVADLEQRGLITVSVAERARRADLGALALTMKAERS